MGKFADMFAELVALEAQVKTAWDPDHPNRKLRNYEWRPTAPPELPAIWNWLASDDYDPVDTARDDDIVVIKATVAAKPSDLGETMGLLTELFDTFCDVVDPALRQRPVLGNKARSARRTSSSSSIDVFNEIPVMCIDMFLRIQLPKLF